MCRSIKTLFNFEPPATEEEVRQASLQFVRKLSGFRTPSQANETVYKSAVDEIALAAEKLLSGLVTNAPTRNRGIEAAKARSRAAKRYGSALFSENAASKRS